MTGKEVCKGCRSEGEFIPCDARRYLSYWKNKELQLWKSFWSVFFSSRRPEVVQSIPEDERAQFLLNLDLFKDTLPLQQALGLQWDMESDKFIFDGVLKAKPTTRKGIISLVSSVYNPLGFLVPVVLPAKKLLQHLCREKLGWDDPTSKIEGERWEN
ncbi:hypothetical protein P5673_018634 [Acropora cervicornis]|uniref:Uncharacterized protein n=1 Tax=Acropora cervicornis TaxID=6130 RepID=A0AAD9V2Q3_ACRCE|nr:hypothetical protein P5673_018634 [Acropora cervicornis]